MNNKQVHIRFSLPKWMLDNIDELQKQVKSKGGRKGYIIGAIKRDLSTRKALQKESYKLTEEVVESVTQAIVDSINEVMMSGMTVDMLRSPQRLSNSASGARHAAWHILRDINAPCEAIGKFFNRDHSSIVYGSTSIRNMKEVYPGINWLILSAKKKCGLYDGAMPDKPEWIEFVTRREHQRSKPVKHIEPLGDRKPKSTWTPEEAAERKRLLRSFATITTSEGYMVGVSSPEY